MARPRQISDEKILEVARACLLENGPTTSTAFIARRAGVSQAVLFQRFSTKEQLVRAALVPDAEAPWIPIAEAGPDERDARAQLVELASAVQAFFADIAPRLELLRTCGIEVPFKKGDADSGPVRGQRAIAGWLRRAVARGLVPDCNENHMAYIFLGALQIRFWFQHVLGSERPSVRDSRAFVAQVVDLVLNARNRSEPARRPSRSRRRPPRARGGKPGRK